MQRSIAKRLWYGFLHVTCRLAAVVVFRIRVRGREHAPANGAGLVLSSHQSHLDPVLIGLALDRRLNYLARDTLFGFAPFRWLIHSLDAIPLDREGLGLNGLRETLKRLKRGELVLIFPEGTRTTDGQVGSLKPGFSALAARADAWLLPVAIVGAYAAWPKRKKFPGRATIVIQIGPPLSHAEVATWGERELVAEIDRRIRACHAEAVEFRRRLDGGDCR